MIPSLASEIVGSEVDHPMIWEVREAIEARRRSAADLKAMRASLDLMETVIAGGDDGIQEDHRFHHAIIEAVGNPRQRQMTEQLADVIDRTSQASLTLAGRPQVSLDSHCAILAAIEAQDEAAAAEAMRQHVMMVGLDALVVATALSTSRVDLHASREELERTVNAYT